MPDDHPMLVISTKAFNERTGLVVGFPMTHAERHADNPFAIPAPGAKGERGYLLTHQPKSFDWRERNGRAHPWGGGHTKLLAAALKRFDAVFGICNH
jgi:mRNA interferase MazF